MEYKPEPEMGWGPVALPNAFYWIKTVLKITKHPPTDCECQILLESEKYWMTTMSLS